MNIFTGICCLLLSVSAYAQQNESAPDTAGIQPPARLFRPSAVAPLYILDKKEISEKELSLISAQDIEGMEVLHGVSAIERYGEKAKNGVIIITMKQRGSFQNTTQDTSTLQQPVTFRRGTSPSKNTTPPHSDIKK